MIRQWGPISLGDVARHGGVEHDGSLAHADAAPGDDYAPTSVDTGRYEEAMGWMCEGGGEVIDADDVVRARVNREKYCPPLDPVHAEIARGEMAIAVRVFNHPSANPFSAKKGIPVEWLREWLAKERLPLRGTWRPDHKVGFLTVVRQASDMRHAMVQIRKVEGETAAPGCLWRKRRDNVNTTTEHIRQESSNGSTTSTLISTGDDLLTSPSIRRERGNGRC